MSHITIYKFILIIQILSLFRKKIKNQNFCKIHNIYVYIAYEILQTFSFDFFSYYYYDASKKIKWIFYIYTFSSIFTVY